MERNPPTDLGLDVRQRVRAHEKTDVAARKYELAVEAYQCH